MKKATLRRYATWPKVEDRGLEYSPDSTGNEHESAGAQEFDCLPDQIAEQLAGLTAEEFLRLMFARDRV